MDIRTQQLDLTAPIPTGNIKAAAAAAGATSADLWMVPYEQLHYDPADNIRPVDPEWVAHLTALILANGFDKGSPLHCYARKVDGKDLLFVYKGQHRYLAAGKAIEAGAKLDKIPVVVRDAKTVNRAEMVIDGIVSNEGKRSSPLDLAAAIAELRDVHGMTIATICKRLNITDQTVRDVALLERAPAELHRMVRDGTVAGTLAIEQIREHGAEKALNRLRKGAAKAAASGKARVTKKHLDAAPARSPSVDARIEAQTSTEAVAGPTTRAKISEKRSKQLLQALQAVLHDPVFGKLSPGTIEAVHTALTPLSDLLDAVSTRSGVYPVATANEHGVYTPTDVLSAPKQQRTGRSPVEIHVALIADRQWIYGMSYTIGAAGGASPCSYYEGMPTYPTRVQAIRGAVSDLTRRIETSATMSKAKEAASVRKWLDKLYAMPDPDWTAEMAKEASK
ncbi:pyridoxal phosphate biosynthetic protein PdxJ [Burkholderia multivorans]|uniref:ParB/RepB/Spo0J family partition protein n=1 Tax=Burkholderia multivorans TaxID=87883 RepID=UPI002B24E3AB|nr:pyridoxal phosphate biosynthetic protein PdxJ [Burkholderia multivorans]MEB2510735.1 pyridoxal phosphate biosynthetic protein PdxJ [Burkholderia multivorans]MEB2520723.1 pyridoxal phosphate biosynthetic protein PdxJ [Burkholderia multivorans]MEB2573025.1 pyridoxal phosphate biosynthetic protein PdxJ [Burkholderia multivorans]MEB2591709.1 pyridoxal phosphate biosynthetic protein PdxJ [Burkholderia multivorans]